MKNLLFTFLLFFLLFSAPEIFAGEQINVKSLTITKAGSGAPTKFELKTINSAGQPVDYFIENSSVVLNFNSYIGCAACNPPLTYETDIFPNPIVTQLNSASNKMIYFYLDSVDSTPIYFANIYRRKKNFTVRGVTRLKGRVEIIDAGLPPADRIVAFDNDVELNGTYAIGFFKPNYSPSGRLLTNFRDLAYSLKDTGE